MTQPAQYISGRTVQEQMDQLIGYVDTRAAEVATDAIASDVAQVHQDMLDADADASAAAASAAAAAGTLANAVKKTGEASQSIAGDISIGGALAVTGASAFTGAVTVPAPSANLNPATKKYVDDTDALKISITDINTYAVGLTGNQGPITGWKSFNAIEYVKYYHEINTDNTADNAWRKAFSIEMTANKEIEVEIVSGFNNVDTQRAHLYINSTSTAIRCAVISTEGSSSNQASASNYVCVKDGSTVILYTLKRNRYTNLFASIVRSSGYGYNSAIPTVTWLNEAAVDPSTETHDYIGVGSLIPYRNVV